MRKGYYKSNKYPQRFCDFFSSANGLLSDKALCLAADSDGTVFIGTESGLNFTKADGTFGTFACGKVTNAHADGKNVYFSADKTIYLFNEGKISELQTFEEEITGISGKDTIFVITSISLALYIASKRSFSSSNSIYVIINIVSASF